MKRNPGYLGYIEGYTTQFCGDYNRPLLRIPITQPVFHEKYGRAFLVAHLVLAGLFTHAEGLVLGSLGWLRGRI